MAYTLSSQSPSFGYISWTGVQLVYGGTTYSPADGQTNKRYVWFDPTTPTILNVGDGLPDFATDGSSGTLVFFNKSGVGISVLDGNAIHGSTVIDGSLTVDAFAADNILAKIGRFGEVQTDHLAANVITGDKLTVDAIETHHISADAVEARNISADAIQARHITASTITTEKIVVGAVTTSAMALLTSQTIVPATGVHYNVIAGELTLFDFTTTGRPLLFTSAADLVIFPSVTTRIDLTGGVRFRVYNGATLVAEIGGYHDTYAIVEGSGGGGTGTVAVGYSAIRTGIPAGTYTVKAYCYVSAMQLSGGFRSFPNVLDRLDFYGECGVLELKV